MYQANAIMTELSVGALFSCTKYLCSTPRLYTDMQAPSMPSPNPGALLLPVDITERVVCYVLHHTSQLHLCRLLLY